MSHDCSVSPTLLGILTLLEFSLAVVLLLGKRLDSLPDLPLLLEFEEVGEAVVGVALVDLQTNLEVLPLLEHPLVLLRELLAQSQVLALEVVQLPSAQFEVHRFQVGKEETVLRAFADERHAHK
jgi:hypothetical protein